MQIPRKAPALIGEIGVAVCVKAAFDGVGFATHQDCACVSLLLGDSQTFEHARRVQSDAV